MKKVKLECPMQESTRSGKTTVVQLTPKQQVQLRKDMLPQKNKVIAQTARQYGIELPASDGSMIDQNGYLQLSMAGPPLPHAPSFNPKPAPHSYLSGLLGRKMQSFRLELMT